MEIKEILKEMKKKGINKHFLSLYEVSKILGVHRNTLKIWIDSGIIPGTKYFDPNRKKLKYVVPIWFLRDLLHREDYQIYLKQIKEIFDKKKKIEPLFLNTVQVAKVFNVSGSTVIKWIEKNYLRAIRIYNLRRGRYRYFIPIWAVKELFSSEEEYHKFIKFLRTSLTEIKHEN